jgi:hypothetical protein
MSSWELCAEALGRTGVPDGCPFDTGAVFERPPPPPIVVTPPPLGGGPLPRLRGTLAKGGGVSWQGQILQAELCL